MSTAFEVDVKWTNFYKDVRVTRSIVSSDTPYDAVEKVISSWNRTKLPTDEIISIDVFPWPKRDES